MKQQYTGLPLATLELFTQAVKFGFPANTVHSTTGLPTLADIAEWLRVEHRIYIYPTPHCVPHEKGIDNYWQANMVNLSLFALREFKGYATHTEALTAGICQSFELLKNK